MLRFQSAIAIAPLGHPISFALMLSSLAVAACSKAVETAARPAPVRVQQVSLTALPRRSGRASDGRGSDADIQGECYLGSVGTPLSVRCFSACFCRHRGALGLVGGMLRSI
jgi:hypothetical protein